MTDPKPGAQLIIMTYPALKGCSVCIKIWKSQLKSVNSSRTRVDPWSVTEPSPRSFQNLLLLFKHGLAMPHTCRNPKCDQSRERA